MIRQNTPIILTLLVLFLFAGVNQQTLSSTLEHQLKQTSETHYQQEGSGVSSYLSQLPNYAYGLADVLIGRHLKATTTLRLTELLLSQLHWYYFVHTHHPLTNLVAHIEIASLLVALVADVGIQLYAGQKPPADFPIMSEMSTKQLQFKLVPNQGEFASGGAFEKLSEQLTERNIASLSLTPLNQGQHIYIDGKADYNNGEKKSFRIQVSPDLSEGSFYWQETACMNPFIPKSNHSSPLSLFSRTALSRVFHHLDGIPSPRLRPTEQSIKTDGFTITSLNRTNPDGYFQFLTCNHQTGELLLQARETSDIQDILQEHLTGEIKSGRSITHYFNEAGRLLIRETTHIMYTVLLDYIGHLMYAGTCGICLNDMTYIPDLANCRKHWFCSDCLRRWTSTLEDYTLNCPLCHRQNIPSPTKYYQ